MIRKEFSQNRSQNVFVPDEDEDDDVVAAAVDERCVDCNGIDV